MIFFYINLQGFLCKNLLNLYITLYEVYNLIIVLSVATRNIPLELSLRLVVTRDASSSLDELHAYINMIYLSLRLCFMISFFFSFYLANIFFGEIFLHVKLNICINQIKIKQTRTFL